MSITANWTAKIMGKTSGNMLTDQSLEKVEEITDMPEALKVKIAECLFERKEDNESDYRPPSP